MYSTFWRQWVALNTGALFLGYLLDTPIAHGITGKHAGLNLAPAQLMAHIVALSLVATLVALAQRRALAPYVTVAFARVATAPMAVNLVFWFGWYQTVLPPDIRFDLAAFVFGSWMWVGNLPARGHRLAATVALLAFPIAGIVGRVLFGTSMALLKIPFDVENSSLQHTAFYLAYGVTIGLLGGWLSGLALTRLLPARTSASAA